jgi:hypothetical protein
MGKHGLIAQRLAALFVAAALLFDFPLLGLAQGSALVVFAAWALVIVILAILMERPGAE